MRSLVNVAILLEYCAWYLDVKLKLNFCCLILKRDNMATVIGIRMLSLIVNTKRQISKRLPDAAQPERIGHNCPGMILNRER